MNLPHKDALLQRLQAGIIDQVRGYQRRYYYRPAPGAGSRAQDGLSVGLVPQSMGVTQVESALRSHHITRYLLEPIPQRVTIYQAAERLPQCGGWTMIHHPVRSDTLAAIRDIVLNHAHQIRDWREGLDPLEGMTQSLCLRILGAGGEVGRSCNLIQMDRHDYLVDCGLGFGSSALPYIDRLNLNRLSGVYLTHAHYDHSGGIPLLMHRGYRGPVYCTKPTLTRAYGLWMDYLKLAQRPLYDHADVVQTVKRVILLEPSTLYHGHAPGVTVQAHPAGHMPGSVMYSFGFDLRHRSYRMLFTGDYGQRHSLYRADLPRAAYNVVVSEGTYGDSPYRNPLQQELKGLRAAFMAPQAQLGEVLFTTLEARAPVVYHTLRGVFQDQRVWVSRGVMQSMRMDLQDLGEYHPSVSPAVAASLEAGLVETSKLSARLFLATPGMLQGGDSLSQLLKLAPVESNRIVLTCFMPRCTVGRALLDSPRGIRIRPESGRPVSLDCRAQVHHLTGYSAHASGETIKNFMDQLQPNLIILQHGQHSHLKNLARLLQKDRHRVLIPKNLEAIRLI